MNTPKSSTSESIARQPTAAGTPTAVKTANIRYVDRPECGETFADAVNSIFFDGQSLRIEFGITRMDEVKKDAPLTGRRYPACRLVLPPAAAVDLINKIQQTAAALEQAGLVKANRKDNGPAAP
jgi:hypothetical protein